MAGKKTAFARRAAVQANSRAAGGIAVAGFGLRYVALRCCAVGIDLAVFVDKRYAGGLIAAVAGAAAFKRHRRRVAASAIARGGAGAIDRIKMASAVNGNALHRGIVKTCPRANLATIYRRHIIKVGGGACGHV